MHLSVKGHTVSVVLSLMHVLPLDSKCTLITVKNSQTQQSRRVLQLSVWVSVCLSWQCMCDHIVMGNCFLLVMGNTTPEADLC